MLETTKLTGSDGRSLLGSCQVCIKQWPSSGTVTLRNPSCWRYSSMLHDCMKPEKNNRRLFLCRVNEACFPCCGFRYFKRTGAPASLNWYFRQHGEFLLTPSTESRTRKKSFFTKVFILAWMYLKLILYRLRSTQKYPHFEDFFIDQRWLKFRIFYHIRHISTLCVIIYV